MKGFKLALRVSVLIVKIISIYWKSAGFFSTLKKTSIRRSGMSKNKQDKVRTKLVQGDSNRRKFLQSLGIGVVSGGALVSSSVLAQNRVITPPQTEGPFFPVFSPLELDADLTRLAGKNEIAKGKKVVVFGIVLDAMGRPVEGAVIDIWQACFSGRYRHPQDPNTGVPLDPNFQYWAKLTTNENGEFRFKTIVPGAYPATNNWDRPPHVHFRVSSWGHEDLTTQMYFKGHPLNDVDLILQETSQTYGDEARDSLIVDFGDSLFEDTEKEQLCEGQFTLRLSKTPSL